MSFTKAAQSRKIERQMKRFCQKLREVFPASEDKKSYAYFEMDHYPILFTGKCHPAVEDQTEFDMYDEGQAIYEKLKILEERGGIKMHETLDCGSTFWHIKSVDISLANELKLEAAIKELQQLALKPHANARPARLVLSELEIPVR